MVNKRCEPGPKDSNSAKTSLQCIKEERSELSITPV